MKDFCSKCNSGVLRPTKYPEMLKCDFCGVTRCELTKIEYLEKQKLGASFHLFAR